MKMGKGKKNISPSLKSMSGQMSNAYCAFAPGAATPVLGLVEDFVEEIQEHISQKKCPFTS